MREEVEVTSHTRKNNADEEKREEEVTQEATGGRGGNMREWRSHEGEMVMPVLCDSYVLTKFFCLCIAEVRSVQKRVCQRVPPAAAHDLP